MHPGLLHKWKRARRRRSCGDRVGGGREHGYEAGHDGLGREFGVRRPLRFMAHKLELDDEQVKQLAAILNDLKTERAQAAVDHQRTVSAIADAIAADTFDEKQVRDALEHRVTSAQQLRNEVLRALQRTHTLLRPDQREKLAYMLRAGTLTI